MAILNQKIAEVEKEIAKTPDIAAQKEMKQVQLILKALPRATSDKELNLAQYEYISEQASLAMNNIEQAKVILLKQRLEATKKKALDLIPPTNDFILQMNQMYQKRPTLSLLADIIQNSEKQRAILERSATQFKKNLTAEQIYQIADIMQTAYDKVARAFDYANELYAGRQNQTTNTINRIGQ